MILHFLSYFKVGILNTLVHWSIFFVFFHLTQSQSISNVVAFAVAMSISFVLNAKYTFKQKMTVKAYLLFALFMAALSYGSGYVGDVCHLNPLITLVFFSGLSLVIGFIYSKFVVFKP